MKRKITSGSQSQDQSEHAENITYTPPKSDILGKKGSSFRALLCGCSG